MKLQVGTTQPPLWNEFLSRHSAWVKDRLAESDELFFVPIARDNVTFDRAFGTGPGESAAEQAFTGLCRKSRIVGVRVIDPRKIESSARFIQYKGFEPKRDAANDNFLDLGRQRLGWTDEQIENARVAFRRAVEMAERLVSAAGRLVCNPDFLTGRNALRNQWLDLKSTERPGLPLLRIVQVLEQPPKTKERNLSDQAMAFVNDFEAFCEKWQLNGFETWELPRPCAPQWPDLNSSQGVDPITGTMVLSTPWHFPVLDSDNLGRVAMEQHLADRQRHGIDDARSWQLYAQLLRLDFWERILRGRYVENFRSNKFSTEVYELLAEILEVSSDHVERLVKRHRALRSGKLRSLAGLR
jgi:hypothetical protein